MCGLARSYNRLFGERFRQWRLQSGLTYKEAAFELRVSVGTLQTWDRGVIPQPYQLERLYHVSGKRPGYWFKDNDDEQAA